jgi:hypothetical protein
MFGTEFAVLYSRLHVVGASKRVLLAVKIMCISEFSLVTIPTAVISSGLAAGREPGFIPAAATMYRIESVAWSVCNIAIAATYFSLLLQNFKGNSRDPDVRKFFIHVLCSILLLVMVDSAWIAIVFSGLTHIEPVIVSGTAHCTY